MKASEEEKERDYEAESGLTPQERAVVDAFRNDTWIKGLFNNEINLEKIVAHIGEVNQLSPGGNSLLNAALMYSEYVQDPITGIKDFDTKHILTLLNLGADPLMPNEFSAAKRASIFGSTKALDAMLTYIPKEQKKEICSKLLGDVVTSMAANSPRSSEKCQVLLEHGADANFDIPGKGTPMYLATTVYGMMGSVKDTVLFLMKNGGQLNKESEGNDTPLNNIKRSLTFMSYSNTLLQALENGNIEGFKEQVNNGADISSGYLLNTVMLYSEILNDNSPVKTLIKSGRLSIPVGMTGLGGAKILEEALVGVVAEQDPNKPLGLTFASDAFSSPITQIPGLTSILKLIKNHDGPIRDAINKSIHDSFQKKTLDEANAPDNIVDLISQFADVPFAEYAHMDRINKERERKVEAETTRFDLPPSGTSAAAAPPAPATTFIPTSSSKEKIDQAVMDKAWDISRNARGEVIGIAAEPRDIESFPSQGSRRGSVSSKESEGYKR